MKAIKNIVVVSDTHFGCQLAVCPEIVNLDGGGIYRASKYQKKLLGYWNYFWDEFVPSVIASEPFIFVHNGDVIDGVHHQSVTQISHNITDQVIIAIEMLKPIVKRAYRYYQIRGTEAHSGKSGQVEEGIAKSLGAIPDETGNASRYDLWLEFGNNKILTHFTHHIGTTNSAAYESTAVHKELIEAYTEAGRWGLKPPDLVIRSHRHRFYEVSVPSLKTNAISVVTPAWQLKTPFVWKGGFGRASTPQIGGIIIREGTEVPVYIRHEIWSMERSRTER
jgi:hypothetical protein